MTTHIPSRKEGVLIMIAKQKPMVVLHFKDKEDLNSEFKSKAPSDDFFEKINKAGMLLEHSEKSQKN